MRSAVLMYLLLGEIISSTTSQDVWLLCSFLPLMSEAFFLILTLNQNPMNSVENYPVVSKDTPVQTGYNVQTHFSGLLMAGTEK